MTCSGHCCFGFSLDQEMVDGLAEDPKEWEDGEFIADMLIPLEDPLTFTCRHHDPHTLLCRVYETRPGMCRRFPEPGDLCGDCHEK